MHYSYAEFAQRWFADLHRVSRHGPADGAHSKQLHTHRPQLHAAGVRRPRSPLQQPNPYTSPVSRTDTGCRATDCADPAPAADETTQFTR